MRSDDEDDEVELEDEVECLRASDEAEVTGRGIAAEGAAAWRTAATGRTGRAEGAEATEADIAEEARKGRLAGVDRVTVKGQASLLLL